MRAGCTCPPDGSRLCATCATLLARAQQGRVASHGLVTRTPPPQARTALPSLEVPVPETAALRQLEALGHQYGWQGETSWMREGDDPGLCCWLVRPPEVLYVCCQRGGRPLPAATQQWLRALRQTAVAVLVWEMTDLAQLEARLRPQRKET